MRRPEKSRHTAAFSPGGSSGIDAGGIWADPEAILRPTEGERLRSILQEFEDERYPLTMALGWSKLALGRLPRNQIALRKLLERSIAELAQFVLADDVAIGEAHRMLFECSGEPSQYAGPPAVDAIEEAQRAELAGICDEDIESAEQAERNTLRLEWYSEKKAAEWIVETLKMLPLDREMTRLRKILVPTRKGLLRRMAEIEESAGFDMTMAGES